VTADGRLRSCLFSEAEIDIRGPLREGASVQELVGIIAEAVATKPERHRLGQAAPRPRSSRRMYAIGG
jgi:cyclic pyranopterin phosphate synthase